MNGRATIMSAAVLCALSVGAVANPGGYKCPCGPIGMPATKYMNMYPNGDKFKMICTNQSPTGNFQSKYCKAGGGQICIGECIYVGGTNQICYTFDARGNPCTITHKNNKPDGTKKKVYVYDVKGGTVTTTCYKKVGTMWMVDGRPVCRRVSSITGEYMDDTTSPGVIEEMFNDDDPGLKMHAVASEPAPPTEDQAQSSDVVAVEAVALLSGARDLTFFSSGVDHVPLAVGDRFVLHGVDIEDLSRVNSKFQAHNRVDGFGVELVSLVDGQLANNERLARVSSSFTHPFDTHANSVASVGATQRLVAVQCLEEALPAEEYEAMAVDTYANIEAPVVAPDVNHDGVVNSADIALILGEWGSAGGPGDATLDGVVNGSDIVSVLNAWGFQED